MEIKTTLFDKGLIEVLNYLVSEDNHLQREDNTKERIWEITKLEVGDYNSEASLYGNLYDIVISHASEESHVRLDTVLLQAVGIEALLRTISKEAKIEDTKRVE